MSNQKQGAQDDPLKYFNLIDKVKEANTKRSQEDADARIEEREEEMRAQIMGDKFRQSMDAMGQKLDDTAESVITFDQKYNPNRQEGLSRTLQADIQRAKKVEEAMSNLPELEKPKAQEKYKKQAAAITDFDLKDAIKGEDEFVQVMNSPSKPSYKATFGSYGHDGYGHLVRITNNTMENIGLNDYLDGVSAEVIKDMPRNRRGNIMVGGKEYTDEEVKAAVTPLIIEANHEALMAQSHEYRDEVFKANTGMTYKQWATSRVQDLAERVTELRKIVGDAAYWEEKERAINTAKSIGSFAPEATARNIALGAEAEAQKPFDDFIEQLESWAYNDFGSGFSATFDGMSVLTGGLVDLFGAKNMSEVLEAAERGEKLDVRGQAMLELHMIQEEVAGLRDVVFAPQSTWNKIGEGVGTSAGEIGGFAIGMLAGGGIGSFANLGVKGAVATTKYVAKKSVLKGIGTGIAQTTKVGARLTYNAGLAYTRGAVGSLVMPSTYTRYYEGVNSQYSVEEDGTVTFTPKDAESSFLGYWVDNASELTSEMFGVGLGKVLSFGSRWFGRMIALNKVAQKMHLDSPNIKRAVKKLTPGKTQKKVMSYLGVSGGAIAEPLSEVYGDFSAQVGRMAMGLPYDFNQFSDADYWKTTAMVSTIYGGSLSVGATAMNVHSLYNVYQLGKMSRLSLNKIEDEELRNKLELITIDGNIERASQELAGIDWSNIASTDRGYAFDYIRHKYAYQVALGERQETTRMNQFAAEAHHITSLSYRGIDGKEATGNLVLATLNDGRRLFVLEGNYTDADGILKCTDELGNVEPIHVSHLKEIRTREVESEVSLAYDKAFKGVIEEERMNEIEATYKGMRETGKLKEEDAKRLMADYGVSVQAGEKTQLVDGREAVVEDIMDDGYILVGVKDATTGEMELLSIPFYDIMSSAPLTAEVQSKRLAERTVEKMTEEVDKESSDIATEEAVSSIEGETAAGVEVETTTPTNGNIEAESTADTGSEVAVGKIIRTKNGQQARVMAVNEDGSIEVDYNLDENSTYEDAEYDVISAEDVLSEAPNANQEEMQETPAEEDAAEETKEIINEITEAESIPQTKDGDIDYDAIDNPEQFAALYEREVGDKETAINDVREMRAAAEEQLAKSVEKGKKLSSANDKTANRKERKALTERIAFYDAVLDALSPRSVENTAQQVDKQGNPLNEDGTLKVEVVASIDEISDVDFMEPTRSIQLPMLPRNVDEALDANGKPVVIKKNIFERNATRHYDLTPEQSRDILRSALYNPSLYGQNQKNRKPYNWVVISVATPGGPNRLVLLEINNNRDSIDVVHWHYIDERGIEKIKRQAEREDGQLLILPPNNLGEVGALSDPTLNMPSTGKDTTSLPNDQTSGQEKSHVTSDEVRVTGSLGNDIDSGLGNMVRFEGAQAKGRTEHMDAREGYQRRAEEQKREVNAWYNTISQDDAIIHDGDTIYVREFSNEHTPNSGKSLMKGTRRNNDAIAIEFTRPLSSAEFRAASDFIWREGVAATSWQEFVDGLVEAINMTPMEPELVSASESAEADIAEPQTEVGTTTETTSFTPGLVEDEYTAKLSGKRRKALHDVAVALGLRVRFVDAVRTAAGGLANADIIGNEVRIAWSKRDKAISFLVGHEFTHRMQELSPKEYASFKESVKAYMGDERWNALVAKTRSTYEAHNAREMARAEAEHRAPRLLQYSVELIEDEVVADFAGELNEDANALAAFAEKLAEKPSTLKAVIAVLRDILNKLKGLVAGAEAQRLANMLSKFEELYRASASRTTEGQTQNEARHSISAIELAEIEAERKSIIETAKANGTYLKAPNGKDTNLTPEQWVEVRTKRFKAWFGDWELAEIAEYLMSDDVVAILSGEEFVKDGIPLTKKVSELYEDNYNGKVTRKGLGEVILDKRSVKDSTIHGFGKAKTAAFAAVPNIITEGRIIDEQKNWKGRNYDSVTIAAPIRIGGSNYVGIVIVRKGQGTNSNRFYLHEVVLQENLQDESFKTDTKADSHRGDIAKVMQKIFISKENSSKIVDANGEPKIVEHSTWNEDFYTFDIEHLGESSGDEGVYGAGFYFGNVGETELYGDRAIQAYLNLHNPLVLPDAPIKGFFDYLVENFDKDGLRDIVVKQGNKTATMGDVLDAIKDVNETHARGEYAELIEQMSQYWYPAEERVLEQQIFRKMGLAIYPTLEPFIQYNVGRKEFSKALRNAGYDGVVYDNQEYVVFNPNQIKSATENIGTYDANNPDIRYSLRELDAPYLDAVERGDMETAQRMVLEAAKLAMPDTEVVDDDGNPKVVYHGTPNLFNVFSKEMFGTSTDRGIWGNGFYFSESPKYADTYKSREGKEGRTISAYLNIKSPLHIYVSRRDDEGQAYFHALMEKHFNDEVYADVTKQEENMRKAQYELSAEMIHDGYDGVIVHYPNDFMGNEYIAFEPNQIKSADPVTYDDNGNVIPLSERFHPEKEDIRYSLIAPTNEEVTYDNFFDGTSAIFKPITKIPTSKADYTSRSGSRYWYGEDKRGKYVIRRSDHWSADVRSKEDAEAFVTKPDDFTNIASCYWAIDMRAYKPEKYDKIELEGVRSINYNTDKQVLNINFENGETTRRLNVVPKDMQTYFKAMKLDGADMAHKYVVDMVNRKYRTKPTPSVMTAKAYLDDFTKWVVEPRYSMPSQPIFYSNAEYAVRGIKQEKATPEQWLKMIEKNGGLKAGEDKWLGLSDWLKASDKKTLTKDEVLQYIAENDIQIEEVEYAQFGPGLIDEATRKLEAEMREIGIEAMREKYDGFDDLFEVYNGELLWSEERASEGEYEDFIIENNIVDVNAQANAINETRLGYTTNGLDNKREIALTVPTIEPWNTSDNIHFGDAGEGRAVAWIRFGETTDADGKRVLVIDEIQSKRHQEGRDKGYRPIQLGKEILLAKEKLAKANRELGDYKSGLKEKYDFKNIKGSFFERHQIFYDALLTEERAQLDTLAEKRNDAEAKWQSLQLKATGIPSAPFEKNWAELAMKRMLRYAAENGFDKVAWTTGDQQAERYDLGKSIDYIEAQRNENGTYNINVATNDDSHYVQEDNISESRLSEVLGKDMMQSIVMGTQDSEDGSVIIEGDGLRIGGEGMKAFYDQMLPSFMRKYAKKWGATVGEVTMPDLEKNNTMHSVDVTPAMRESVMQGQPKFSLRDAETEKIFATAKEKFGTTYDMREAGYILPDGSMLDFSGKHQVRDADTSFLNGGRTVDHREIEDIAYDFDENETGVKTDLGDFLDRGAIRIDYNAGAINLNIAPTRAQKDRLKRLIERNDGYVYIDFGKGWDTEHYAEYEAARASRVLGDIDRYFDEGIKPTGNVRFSLSEVNDRFNKELATLTEENKDKVNLSLGMPSDILLAAGVVNKPMKLYGAKVIKKQKAHGFKLSELENLPMAVAYPIAVFNNYQKDDNRSVLTELTTDDGNFLVSLNVGKDQDIDFNIVATVFGKGSEKIVDWIKKGYATYIDKEKALNYLHHSAPIAEALSNPRLISTTKVIQIFENPKIEPKNSRRVRDDRRLSMPMPDDIFFDENGDIISFGGDDVREATTIVRRAPKTTEERIKMYMESRHLAMMQRIRKDADDEIRLIRQRYNEDREKRTEALGNMRGASAKIDYILGDTPREALPLYDQALILLAEGEVKIRWEDDGTLKGLASELGYKKGEKARMRNITVGATLSFEAFVHQWWQSIGGYANGIDTQDMRNALIEALQDTGGSSTRALAKIRSTYDVARTERDNSLYDVDARRESALAEEEQRYKKEVEAFDTREDKASIIRQYEQSVAAYDEMESIDGLLRHLDEEIRAMRSRAERAESRESQSRKDIYEGIRRGKQAIMEAVRRIKVLHYNSQELNSLLSNISAVRSIKQLSALQERVENIITSIQIREENNNFDKLLNLRLPNWQMVETWVNEKVYNGVMTAAEGKRIMSDMWRGTNSRGVAVAKYVDQATGDVMRELRDMVSKVKKRRYEDKEDENGEIKKVLSEDKELSMDVAAARKANGERAVQLATKNLRGEATAEEITEMKARYLYSYYLDVVEAKQNMLKAKSAFEEAIGNSAVDTADARSEYFASKEAYRDVLRRANIELDEFITKGRDAYKSFMEAQEEHRQEIVRMGLNAIGKQKPKDGIPLNWWQKVREWNRRSINNPYWTFETTLREIDHLSPNGKGVFYNFWMQQAQSASDEFVVKQITHVSRLGEKINRLWGFKYSDPATAFMAIKRRANEKILLTIKYTKYDEVDGDIVKRQNSQPITIANGLYMLAMWGQERYRRGMEKQGITVNDIMSITQAILNEPNGEQYIAFKDWVIGTFLTDTREEYDVTHQRMFGTSMDKEANYFPAKVVDRHRDEQLGNDNNNIGDLYVSGIIRRQTTSAMIDAGADFFAVLGEHIQSMDRWSAFAELQRDIKYLINSNEFKDRLVAHMPGKGDHKDGEGSLYRIFFTAAEILLDKYKSKATVIDNVALMAQKGWATANISWRGMTAIKQLASLPTFLYYADDLQLNKLFWKNVAKYGVGAWKYKQLHDWCKSVSPSYRRRWQTGDMGIEFLGRKISTDSQNADIRRAQHPKVVKGFEWFDKVFTTVGKDLGMFANKAIDAFSVAVGLRTIYEFEVSRLTENGKKELTEEMKKKAVLRAEMAFNATQQSSENAYLAEIQKQRSVASAVVTTYLNQPFAMHRLRMGAMNELWNQFFNSKAYVLSMIDKYGKDWQKEMQAARHRAYAEFMQGILSDYLFQLIGTGIGGVCLLAAAIDDDEDEALLGMIQEVAFNGLVSTTFGGYLGGNLVQSAIGGYFKRPSDLVSMPAQEELVSGVWETVEALSRGDATVSLYNTLGMLARYSYGVDPETAFNIIAGVEAMIKDEGTAEGILKILNAPRSQVALVAGKRREGESVWEYIDRRVRVELMRGYNKWVTTRGLQQEGLTTHRSAPLSISGTSALHHAHAATCGHRRQRIILLLLCQYALRREKHRGNRSSILQSHARHLRRVDNTRSKHILVAVITSVVAKCSLALLNLVHHYRALATGVSYNLAQRLLNSALNNLDTRCLVVIFALHAFERLHGTDVGNATTRHDTLLYGSTCCRKSIIHSILLLLHLDLGSSTYVEYRNATCELGKTLLQLLAVVVRCSILD